MMNNLPRTMVAYSLSLHGIFPTCVSISFIFFQTICKVFCDHQQEQIIVDEIHFWILAWWCLYITMTSRTKKYTHNTHNTQSFKPSWRPGLDYADCINCREIRPASKIKCSGYDTKLHLMVRLQFWRSGEYRVPLHCHYFQAHSDP